MSVIWLINKRATNNLLTHILEFKNETNQNISIHSIQNLKKKQKNNERLHTSDKHIITTKKQCRNNRRLEKKNYTFFLSKFYQRCKKGVKNKIKN